MNSSLPQQQAYLTEIMEKDPNKNLKNIYQMSYHVSLAEHRAISMLCRIDPEAEIGPVCAIQVVYPRSSRPEDEEDLKGSKPDFIGINYYFSITAKKKEGQINYDQPPFWISDAFDECENPYLEVTEWIRSVCASECGKFITATDFR